MGQAEFLYHERVFPHLEATNRIPVFENLATLRCKTPRQFFNKLFYGRRHLGRDRFAVAERTGERIDPARPRAHAAQRSSQLLFEEGCVPNIERANDVSGEFPIAEAFRLCHHAVVVAHFGQAHHFSSVFEHRNPEIPILSRFDLLTITSHAVEVFASVEGAGRNVVAACQESEREIGEVPAPTASADEINRGAHNFHLRLLIEHGDSVCNEGRCEQVVGIDRQNVATPRGGHRDIACATGTRVRLVEQTNASVGFGQRFHDLGRTVGRTIVHHHHFQGPKRGSQHRMNGGFDIGLRIVERHDHRHERRRAVGCRSGGGQILSNPFVHFVQ